MFALDTGSDGPSSPYGAARHWKNLENQRQGTLRSVVTLGSNIAADYFSTNGDLKCQFASDTICVLQNLNE